MTPHDLMKFRRFVLNRIEDESGVSGTGIIAEGVQFSNNKSIISWISDTPSVEVYDSVEEVERIHGHNGKTAIRWIDEIS